MKKVSILFLVLMLLVSPLKVTLAGGGYEAQSEQSWSEYANQKWTQVKS